MDGRGHAFILHESVIDAIYCLTRPQRSDRRDLLMQGLRKAFSLRVLPELEVNWFTEPLRENVFVPGSWTSAPGHYAATRAHVLMLEEAWRKNYSCVLILEDDAHFKDEFYNDFLKLWDDAQEHAPDWLALFLGYHKRCDLKPVLPNLVVNKGSTHSHGYIINRHGIWRFLDHLWVRGSAVVDWAYLEIMQMEDCVYSPPTPLIGTIESFSDNLGYLVPQT